MGQFSYLWHMGNEKVILVDEHDKVIGEMEKMEAHHKGVLHRAFSVFVFNEKEQLLVHQRALDKYHSAGLWTNTCCSHPRIGESIEAAAHRRLQEEMGFDCSLIKAFSFTYRSEFSNGLIENELDHVFLGKYEGEPEVNPLEVAAYKWKNLEELRASLSENPEMYTEWFKIIFPRVMEFYLREGKEKLKQVSP